MKTAQLIPKTCLIPISSGLALYKEIKASQIRIHSKGAFHRIVEDELYEIESYDNNIQFLGKVYAYQLYFSAKGGSASGRNYIRKNRHRDNKSPMEILRERFPQIDEGVPNLSPIRLETLFPLSYKKKDKSGCHIPIPVHFVKKIT